MSGFSDWNGSWGRRVALAGGLYRRRAVDAGVAEGRDVEEEDEAKRRRI